MSNAPITTINDELLAELEQLAGKATPGPWGWDGPVWAYDPENEAPWLIRESTGGPVIHGSLQCSEENAEYLAVANPATILALLQHVRELRVDAERLDFLQEQASAAPNQRFGISLQWLPTCEGEPSGYRYMHRKFATDQRKTLRAAIDAARSSTNS